MGERALVLSADVWNMTDKDTGQVLNGVSVWYVNDYRQDDQEAFGFKPTKVSATPEMLEKLRGKLPGIFELSFGSRPGAQSKATLTLIGVKFIEEAALFGKVAKAAALPA